MDRIDCASVVLSHFPDSLLPLRGTDVRPTEFSSPPNLNLDSGMGGINCASIVFSRAVIRLAIHFSLPEVQEKQRIGRQLLFDADVRTDYNFLRI